MIQYYFTIVDVFSCSNFMLYKIQIKLKGKKNKKNTTIWISVDLQKLSRKQMQMNLIKLLEDMYMVGVE